MRTQLTTSENASETDLTSSHKPDGSFLVGSTTVTYTATDPYGNLATTSFDVVTTGRIFKDIAIS